MCSNSPAVGCPCPARGGVPDTAFTIGSRRRPSHISPAIMEFQSAADQLRYAVSLSGLSMREWYRTVYLASAHWQNLRARVFESQGRLCAKCGATRVLDVHHLNYHHIFDVQPLDLQVLCRSCHENEHEPDLPSDAQWPPQKPDCISPGRWARWIRRMDQWMRAGRYKSGAPPRFPRPRTRIESLVIASGPGRRMDRLRRAHAAFVANERHKATKARLLAKGG